MSELTKDLGSRIKMYRKLNGCSLAEFSKAINKSRSTISKYEHGEITIDIETLYEIAGFFQIPVTTLLGESAPQQHSTVHVPAFFDAKLYYLYLYNGIRKELQRGVMEVNAESGAVSLYLYFNDFEHYRECAFLCNGTIRASSSIINLILESYLNDSSVIHMCFYHPVRSNETLLVGQLSSQMLPAAPMCTKCVLSKRKLTERQELIDFLKYSKTDIAEIKKTNLVSTTYSIDAKNL